MPELPEVETTVRGLAKSDLKDKKILDVWCDTPKTLKEPDGFSAFKKAAVGRKISGFRRRGKHVIIDLSGNKSLIFHLKLTGHLIVRRGSRADLNVKNLNQEKDSYNNFVHFALLLSGGKILKLSDLRKFGWVQVVDTDKVEGVKSVAALGPEPLEPDFTFNKFKSALAKKHGRIKQVLMKQEVIAGIGNIYGDEILLAAGIHPESRLEKLSDRGLRAIYRAMRKILPAATDHQGTSVSDFRTTSGTRGKHDSYLKVYRRTGKACVRAGCRGQVARVKIGGRSSHFCKNCQKLIK